MEQHFSSFRVGRRNPQSHRVNYNFLTATKLTDLAEYIRQQLSGWLKTEEIVLIKFLKIHKTLGFSGYEPHFYFVPHKKRIQIKSKLRPASSKEQLPEGQQKFNLHLEKIHLPFGCWLWSPHQNNHHQAPDPMPCKCFLLTSVVVGAFPNCRTLLMN